MKISIITCTWNSAAFLQESINSVLSQDYPDIEYIFVDGGSTDGTLDQIAAIDRPVTVLSDKRNGISNAMNVGLRAATGDVVAHLHSDDFYLESTVLSRVAKALESDHAGWCFGRIERLINNQLVAESYTPPSYSWRSLIRGNYIPHPATFVRRAWMMQLGGFDVRLKYAMDYDMWLRLAKLGPATELGVPVAAFREHGGSLSTANRLAAMTEDHQVRLRHYGGSPLDWVPHTLRFLVRRQRLIRSMARSA